MSDLFFGKTYKDFFDFVSNTENELIIICPYIKLEAIKLLLESVKSNVKIVVVARWKINDLIFGSSDVEVFEYLKNLGHNFYIHKDIHLKIIIKDKKEILIGSANITGSGLGLLDNSNIEAIAIDSLDEVHLPKINSILRESVQVDQNLINKISKEIALHKDLKEEQVEINKELKKLEDKIFIKNKLNIIVDDFPFNSSPELFIKSIKNGDYNLSVKHDYKLFKLKDEKFDLERLKHEFLQSNAYLWQLENIKGSNLFGKYSELLHNSLVDDPKPYRKEVKELVSNMFNWTEEFSDEYEVVKHAHTSSMIKK